MSHHHPTDNPLAAKHHPAHVSPVSLYFAVFGALLVLTVVTVLVSVADLGTFALAAALIVATMKASLVCVFFMHLLHDDRFNTFIMVSTIFFIFLFFAFTLLDINTRGRIDAMEANEFYRFQRNLEAQAAQAASEVNAPATARYTSALEAAEGDAPSEAPVAAPVEEEGALPVEAEDAEANEEAEENEQSAEEPTEAAE